MMMVCAFPPEKSMTKFNPLNNGGTPLTPTSCTVTAVLNGTWSGTLVHPIDEEGRWESIQIEGVITLSTWQDAVQFYRVKQIIMTDNEITASLSPIFYDIAGTVFYRYQVENNKTPADALGDLLSAPAARGWYEVESDMTNKASAILEYRNFLDFLCGDSSPTFKQRWGGEIEYDNYTLKVKECLGSNKGFTLSYGRNILEGGLTVTRDTSDLITRIYPKGFNNMKKEDGGGYCDADNVDDFPGRHSAKITFSDIKFEKDASEADKSDSSITIVKDQAAANKALDKKCAAYFEANNCNLPKETIDVEFVMLSKTEEYKDLVDAMSESLVLGDIVYCNDKKLNLQFRARVTALTYDCVLGVPQSITIGTQKVNFYDHMPSSNSVIESSQLAVIQSEATAAQTIAVGAQNSAASALGAAVAAQEAAETANTAAETANESAASAQATATNAQTTAINAQTEISEKTPLVIGTQTAATYQWQGTAETLSELKDGQKITYWLPFSSSGTSQAMPYWKDAAGATQQATNSGATLELTLKDGTTTGKVACFYGGANRLTTHFPAGNSIEFIYRKLVKIGSYYYTGWWAHANYNADTYNRVRMQNIIKAKSAITSACLIVGDENNLFYHLTGGCTFDIRQPILYAGSNIAANGTGDNNYLAINSITLRNNQSGFTGTQHAPVYVVGTLDGTTFTVSSTPFTTTPPTEEDGLTYILLGRLYTTFQIYLYPEHKLFRFANGKFQLTSEIAPTFDKVEDLTADSIIADTISTGGEVISDLYYHDGDEVTETLPCYGYITDNGITMYLSFDTEKIFPAEIQASIKYLRSVQIRTIGGTVITGDLSDFVMTGTKEGAHRIWARLNRSNEWGQNETPVTGRAEVTFAAVKCAVYSQMTDQVAAYLARARQAYSETDYKTNTVVTEFASKDTVQDDPAGYTIPIPSDGALLIRDAENPSIEASVQVEAGEYTIYNAMPDRLYTYYINGGEAGKFMSTGTIRQIYAPGVDNCRDVGGFKGDGGRQVAFGKIFRGVFPDNTTTAGRALIQVLLYQLGVTYEINLENESTDSQHNNLGDTCGYGYFPLVTPSSYEELYDLSSSNTSKTSFIGCLNQAMQNAVNGQITYIHCSRGIDRTGAVCFYLQAILGMSGVDLDISYELTAMTGSLWGSDLTKINRTKAAWVNLRDYFKAYSGAESIRDGVLLWSKDAGIDIDLINQYRAAMLGDGVEELAYPQITAGSVSYALKNIQTPTVTSADVGKAFSVTLTPKSKYTIRQSSVVVKMGGSVVSGAYSGGKISIASVTGDIEITADAYCNQLPISVDEDGTTIYNGGTGFINGKYLSSSGAFLRSTDASFFSTGAIPYTIPANGSPEPIYIKGAVPTAVSHCRFFFTGVYSSTGKLGGMGLLTGTGTAGSVANNGNIFAAYTVETLNASTKYYKLTPVMSGSNAALCGASYRGQVSHLIMSLAGTGDNVIITVGEEIE
ncbi:MAG: phage tail spike protein [Lachnospiraceae bacterium]|nr:phage tail spike protein [Lachnospiraceae bacterium]